MCGIAGIAAVPGRQVAPLDRVCASLGHRGPDDSGVFLDSDYGLVHTRLAIIDLSPAGAQPMTSADGRYVIVYNGEIYNYQEFRQELVELGCVFRGHSDTEALLEGYARWGAAILSRLNGIFAFAIFDRRERELFIARDPLGVKPLYYSSGPFGLCFASEIKALLQLAPIDRTIDELAIQRYLSFLWCPGERTPLKAVRKLDPGAAMIVSGGEIKRRWTYATPPTYAPDPKRSVDQWVHDLRATLASSVERQMMSDVPVGALLSGGVDSSSLVAAVRAQGRQITCFTVRNEGPGEAEMMEDLEYSRLVARQFDMPLVEVPVSARDLIDNLPMMIEYAEEPLADPAALCLYFLSREARSRGINVLLSGAGGDDIFTGYRRHQAARINKYWDFIPRPVRTGMAHLVQSVGKSNTGMRRVSKLMSGIDDTHDRRLMKLFLWTPENVARGLLNPDRFVGGTSDVFEDFASELQRIPGALDVEKCLHLDRRFFLTDHNLTYTDKLSMATGVEIRVPLLDLEMVKLAASIPVDIKQNAWSQKWLFKRSQEGLLPDTVLHRPKRGFGVPLRQWMKSDLLELRDELLAPKIVESRGLFDAASVQKLIATSDGHSEDASYTLLSLMCIELWCRRFVDGTVEH